MTGNVCQAGCAGDRFQRNAVRKAAEADGCHTVRDMNFRQTAAIGKLAYANSGQCFRHPDLYQRSAVGEAFIRQVLQILRENDTGQGLTAAKDIPSNGGVVRQDNLFQTVASEKDIVAKGRDRIGNLNRLKLITFFKRTVLDRGDPVRNGHSQQFRTTNKHSAGNLRQIGR